MSDKRLRELEEEVQALMQEAETQKQVNQDVYAELRRLREHLGLATPGDEWAKLKRS